jgi:hypothetical protein
MSRYDGSDTYVYPGTEVLLNKADIREQAALDVFEADVTAIGQLVKPNSGYRRRMKRYLSTLANQRNPYSTGIGRWPQRADCAQQDRRGQLCCALSAVGAQENLSKKCL